MNNGCGFVRKTAVLELRSWLSNLDLVLTTATNRNRNKQCPRNGMVTGNDLPISSNICCAGELLEVDRLVARSSIQNSVAVVNHFQAINRCFVESGYPKLSILASLLNVTILDYFGVLHTPSFPSFPLLTLHQCRTCEVWRRDPWITGTGATLTNELNGNFQ